MLVVAVSLSLSVQTWLTGEKSNMRLTRRALIGTAAAGIASGFASAGHGATTGGATMVKTKYKFLQLEGIRLFYREAGPENAPPILLLHGFPSSSRMYAGLIEMLGDRFRLIAPDYPGFGHSDAPTPAQFNYTFDQIASTMDAFTEALGLKTYTLFMQDYGVPVGMRMIIKHPERISALIIQNGNLYEEGLGPAWEARRAFWRDRATNEAALRANFLSLETTRKRHLGTDPDADLYDPDLWTDEFAFLSRPGQAEIQIELFYDYRHNVELYPTWQAWLRQHQPSTLVIWGRFDASFTEAGGKAFRKDLPKANIHMLEAGHFAMDTKLTQVAQLVSDFLQ